MLEVVFEFHLPLDRQLVRRRRIGMVGSVQRLGIQDLQPQEYPRNES